MGKIATEADVKSVGGQGTVVTNKCCRKERVADLGCELTKTRNSNQLVEEGTYEVLVKCYFTLSRNYITDVYSNRQVKAEIVDNKYKIGIIGNNWSIELPIAFSGQQCSITFEEIDSSFSSVNIEKTTNCSAEWNGFFPGLYEIKLTDLPTTPGTKISCLAYIKYGDFSGAVTITGTK